MKTLKIGRYLVDRYMIYGNGSSQIGTWEQIAPKIQEILEDALHEANGDLVNFEFVGNLPERDLANTLHEIEAVRKAREDAVRAHEAKMPRPELKELVDDFVTLAWIVDYRRLLRVIGMYPNDPADDDERLAS